MTPDLRPKRFVRPGEFPSRRRYELGCAGEFLGNPYNRLMASPYPKGSEWRKWDLQVQTILDDSYISLSDYANALKEKESSRWEQFVRVVGGEANALLYDSKAYFSDGTISKEDRCLNYSRTLFAFLEVFNPDLACIGITDHNYFDDKLIDTLVAHSRKAKGKVIPGAEVNCAGIHLLLLFANIPCEQSTFSEGIKTLLKGWGITNRTTDGVLTLPTKDVTELIDEVRQEGGIIVFPHCNSDNGLFQERGRTDRTYLANIFNHQPVNLLQSQNRQSAQVIEEYIGKTPNLTFKFCCHISSDARALRDIGRYDKDGHFLWIKADPTFEGLKQILYEPIDRVHVGPTPPIYHDQARVVRALKLSNAKGWFDDVSIPLNTGLVSIIGQKGSGKSALAELIAYAAGSWHEGDSASFLKRAGDHLKGLSVELEWADGTTSSGKLGSALPDASHVRYLSQKFVERLCAEDRIGTELVHEIESVIFSYVDPTDTLNASSFDELRALRTEGTRTEGNRLREDVTRLIKEECDLRDNAAKVPEKKARIKALTEERNGLIKQIPKAASREEARIQKDLQEKREKLTSAQQAAAVDKQKLQKISDIRSRVFAFKSQITRFYSELEDLLQEAGVAEADKASFLPTFPSETEPLLVRRETELKRSLAERDGATENPAEGTIRWLQNQIQTLVQRDTADKAQQQKIKVMQTRIAAIAVEIQRVQAEISRIEGPDKARQAVAHQERLHAYVALFQNLKQEQRTLEDLYARVGSRPNGHSSPEQEQRLEFSIRWDVDLNKWLERGSVLFDQRTTLPYGTMQDLGNAAREILAPAWSSGDPLKISPALEQFVAEFRKTDLKPANYLRSGVAVLDLLQWLYEVDHIRLTYGLKYNGVELEKLSPGTKGIVLLILYLGMDIRDTRPLVVDQPDENLDNESIYELLTSYFKTAKTRRQIILITHNPNLVVNGDSEQVIVASCDRRENGLPHITYQCGSLENNAPEGSGISHQVCRILEGGSDAFRKRELRYSLPERVA